MFGRRKRKVHARRRRQQLFLGILFPRAKSKPRTKAKPRTKQLNVNEHPAGDPPRGIDASPSPLVPNWWGIVSGQLTSWIALGPSFLPRTWWMTAASVGLSQLYGYAVGVGARAARNAATSFIRRRLAPSNPLLQAGHQLAKLTSVWQILLLSGLVLGTTAALVSSMNRQREIATLVDEEPPTPRIQLLGMAAGTAGAMGVLLAVRLFRLQSWGTRQLLLRYLPAFAIPFSGTLLSFGLLYFLNRSFIWGRIMQRIQDAAVKNNLKPLPGRKPPRQLERSGSPESFEPFGTLGRHGKAIVADGPRARHIERYWDAPAKEPVRAYVGLRPTVTIEEAARRALRELKRAGGLERKYLCIYVGTGTGWLSDWSMAAMEFLTRGDCAMVSLQYTVLPSAFAAIFDRHSPQQTAQALYAVVSSELARMPAAKRPKLYMSGESLGAFGGLSEFQNTEDLTRRLDGAVFAGTPQFSPIWQELTEHRVPGSSVIRPRIDDGSMIRFSNRLGDLEASNAGTPYAPWGDHRFILMQHPSDPVVWWNVPLIWKEPEWMTEPRGHDVTEHMSWWPWVSFWQIAADMPMSIATKGGHAHRYYEEYVVAWAAVLGIEADTDTLIEAIRPHIRPH
ncbi:MAG: alpha/beta-hydrolase family protein [Gulosibacter sp.]|uniref:alpha/beta-hydrolase family protein n=1 Tax=Gulosibacter sp. TaxID=2817531 RepID=UPI003F8F8226